MTAKYKAPTMCQALAQTTESSQKLYEVSIITSYFAVDKTKKQKG